MKKRLNRFRKLFSGASGALFLSVVTLHAAEPCPNPAVASLTGAKIPADVCIPGGFTDLTNGGDFSISWNPLALQFVGPVVIAPVAANNPLPSVSGQFDTLSVVATDASQGVLKRLDIFKASGADETNTANPTGAIGPDLNIVNLNFLVLDGLLQLPDQTSLVKVGADQTTYALGWFKPDAITNYALTYGSVSVSAVPAPPAIWLLATGVGGLVARRFRKAA